MKKICQIQKVRKSKNIKSKSKSFIDFILLGCYNGLKKTKI